MIDIEILNKLNAPTRNTPQQLQRLRSLCEQYGMFQISGEDINSPRQSCVIGTFHAMYHTKAGSYVHEMGIKEGGKMALLASVSPMDLAAIDYAIHCDRKPSLLVVTDIDEARLKRAASIYTVEETTQNLPSIPGGKKLIYTQIDLPLTAIEEFEEKGKTDPLFAQLDKLCKANNNLWNPEAEKYLLANAKPI